MKKFGVYLLALILALALVAFVAGCAGGGGGGGGGGGDDDTADDDTTDDDITDDDTDDDTEEPPAAPSDLTATGLGQNITLEWSDNSDNEDGFYVYRREYGKGEFEKIVELGADTTEYLDEDLGLDEDFEYKVTAFNEAGESDDSNIARAQTIPNAPTGLSADGGGTDIALSWTDNSSVESGFYIYRRAYGEDSFTKIATINTPNTTTYQDNAGVEKDYEYKVTAFNSAGESDVSNIARAQTIPNAPTDLEASEVKKYRVSIVWVDNSEIEDGYIVERQVGTKAWETIAVLPANTEEYTNTNLNCESTYEYRVRAYKVDVGVSDYSNTASTTTLDCWSIYTLDSNGDVGFYTSIALDSNDKVHISYLDADNMDLKYATNSSGSWQYFTLDSSSAAGFYSSIALDSNDKVHISYVKDNNLAYITNAGGSWQCSTLAGDTSYTSVAIDSNNKVHIGFIEYISGTLKYATNMSGSWQHFIVDSLAFVGESSISIAVDSNNKAHISYIGFTDDYSLVLRYATNAGNNWQIFTLDPTLYLLGGYTSIALDSYGFAHITYYDYYGGNLKYVTSSGGSGWQYFTIDSGYVGFFNSIIIDANNKAHISYYDNPNSDLKYATNASGSWQKFTLDSAGGVGEYTSIALDSNDKVHISYLDYTNGDLKYATNAEVE